MLHMMRQGEAALVPEAVTALRRGDKRLIRQFAEDLESKMAACSKPNAQQFGGLFNTIECRETWAGVDQAPRAQRHPDRRHLQPDARNSSKLPAFCPVWRVPVAPPAERQPVTAAVPVLLMSGGYDWLTPAAWGARGRPSTCPSRGTSIFRAQGHGVSSQDPVRGTAARRVLRRAHPPLAPALPGRHAARLHRRRRADEVLSTRERKKNE